MKYKLYLSAILMIGLGHTAHTQKAPTPTKFDKLYLNYGYKAAIDAYNLTGNKGNQTSNETIVRLANSYRLIGDTYNAEFWYAQLVQKSDNPTYMFHYAQALQSNGKLKEAAEWFNKYDETSGGTDTRGRELAGAAENIATMFSENEGVSLKTIEANSDKLDFSPFLYKNGIVFSSNRGKGEDDIWTKSKFIDLFFVELDENNNSKGEPNPFKELNSKYHEASASFTKDGSKMFFTRNLYLGGKRTKNSQAETSIGIYSAVKIGNDWENIQPIFVDKDLKYAHPSISPEGEKLYFASDRPGGMGGMDLYVSAFEGGKWSEPKNLGATINTPGNEIFPFVHETGTLYFASDGHAGLGGLDIYATNADEAGEWGSPSNMGKPFNSNKDDFGFVADAEAKKGFLSSSRDGGKGGDDIYSFIAADGLKKQKAKEIVLNSKICVYDKATNKRIEGAKVSVMEVAKEEGDNTDFDTNDNELTFRLEKVSNDEYRLIAAKSGSSSDGKSYITDKEGQFGLKIKHTRKYIFKVQKDGYEPATQVFTTETMDKEEEIGFCIPVERILVATPNYTNTVTGKVVNGSYKNLPLANVEVTLLNKCNGETTKVNSKDDGSFLFGVQCGCDYVLLAEKPNFNGAKEMVGEFSAKNCPTTANKTLSLKLDKKLSEMSDKDVVNWNENDVINLSQVYYDFDKSYIREDARPDLDHLVQIMQRFPNLDIELSSHTDSRGNDAYNQALSQRRADAAKEYLVAKGIPTARILAKGFGEAMPKNRCSEGVNCTEEEHQSNRRTEVRVLRFDKSNEIKVINQNNAPTKIDRKPGK